MNIERIINVMCKAAALVVVEGMEFARKDDPHRFATLPRDFDDGQACQRLALDYLPGGQVQVTLTLTGTHAGEAREIEVFRTMVQGPVDTEAH